MADLTRRSVWAVAAVVAGSMQGVAISNIKADPAPIVIAEPPPLRLQKSDRLFRMRA